MEQEVIEELKSLKETAKAIAYRAHQLGCSLEDVARSINAIKPIESAIDKSILKLENQGRSIPKQSAIKNIRS